VHLLVYKYILHTSLMHGIWNISKFYTMFFDTLVCRYIN